MYMLVSYEIYLNFLYLVEIKKPLQLNLDLEKETGFSTSPKLATGNCTKCMWRSKMGF